MSSNRRSQVPGLHMDDYRVRDLARLDGTRPCEQVTAWFRKSLRLLRRFEAQANIEAE